MDLLLTDLGFDLNTRRTILRRMRESFRSKGLAPVMTELQTGAAAGRLSVPLLELAPSYLRMHANRLLRSAQRPQELVLYDFLRRYYESRAARPVPAPPGGGERPHRGEPDRVQPQGHLPDPGGRSQDGFDRPGGHGRPALPA
jgi:hypothetical protein